MKMCCESRSGSGSLSSPRSGSSLSDWGPGLASHGGHGSGIAAVTVFDAFAERIEGHVVVVAHAVGGDRSGVHRAVEDPPAAFVLPHHPGVADVGTALHLADDEAGVGVLKFFAEPEGFVFAIADFAGGGLLGEAGL